MGPKKNGGELTLSPSALNTYLKCGVLFRYTYIDGRRQPPAFAMVMGTGLHAGVEAHMKEKIKTGEDPALDLAVNAAVEGLHKELDTRAKMIADTGMDPDPDPEENPQSIETKVIEGITTFHTEAAPAIMPLEAEGSIRIPMNDPRNPDGPPMAILTGRKDLVARPIDVVEGKPVGFAKTTKKAILDVKFQKNKPTESDVLKSTQLMTYYVAQKAEDQGDAPVQVGLVGVTKTKKPQVVTAVAVPTAEDELRLMRQIGRVLDGIKKGVYLPAPPPPFSWWCSEKSCGFWKECKERMRG